MVYVSDVAAYFVTLPALLQVPVIPLEDCVMHTWGEEGATVAQWLDCSPSTKDDRVQSAAGSLQIFSSGNRVRQCRWSVRFLGYLLFPLPLHSDAALYSPHLIIDSQDLAVKSRPSLFNHSTSKWCKRDSVLPRQFSSTDYPDISVTTTYHGRLRGSHKRNCYARRTGGMGRLHQNSVNSMDASLDPGDQDQGPASQDTLDGLDETFTRAGDRGRTRLLTTQQLRRTSHLPEGPANIVLTYPQLLATTVPLPGSVGLGDVPFWDNLEALARPSIFALLIPLNYLTHTRPFHPTFLKSDSSAHLLRCSVVDPIYEPAGEEKRTVAEHSSGKAFCLQVGIKRDNAAVCGVSRGSSISPLLHSSTALLSLHFTLICSQDLNSRVPAEIIPQTGAHTEHVMVASSQSEESGKKWLAAAEGYKRRDYGLSSRAIARKLNRPKSTVPFVLRKWKVDGHCANAARSGRPSILTDRNHRTLKREIVKNRAQPMTTIRKEFHAATGVSVSIGTLRTEATDWDVLKEQLHISPISQQAIKLADSGGVWTIATGHRSSGNRFCGVISRGLHYSGPMDVYGCGVYQGNGFCRSV
ncbi:hypothetical protein PR048_007160 [Dryococelus australis]|uniref:Uncharacterized protein n=1 Tax=Dryococelus australis TaxID=614101 RepID=A0ABQ9ICW6_9NEOP|nr:hypothetical protein PR048_007160 [Dryococelus australis]